jgi:hypothetical protein
VKTLPVILAGANVAVSVTTFAAAIASPERSGLMPIITFAMDFPASILLVQTHDLLYPHLPVRTSLCIDGLIFTVGGALWFYMIGWIVSKCMRKAHLWV